MNRVMKGAFVALCACMLAGCGSPRLSSDKPEGFVATTVTSEGGRACCAIVVDDLETKKTHHFGIGHASTGPSPRAGAN